jgi:hypothetical protein
LQKASQSRTNWVHRDAQRQPVADFALSALPRDREISLTLGRYGLENEELHTAWILRNCPDKGKYATLSSGSIQIEGMNLSAGRHD